MARDKDVLRYFLEELPKDELINICVQTIDSLTRDNDKSFKDIQHSVITLVHTRQLIKGETMLKSVSEEHRKECFILAIKSEAKVVYRKEIDDAAALVLYEDWMTQNKSFTEWILTLQR